MDPRARRRLILAAAVVGLVLRLAFGWAYWVGKPLTHDEREYLLLASRIAEGHGLTYPDTYDTGTGQRFGRSPAYPAFLSLFRPHPGEPVPASIKAAQAVLMSIAVLLIAGIARTAAGDRAAVIAAWIAALYPPLIWLPAYALSESLYLPVALACTMLLTRLTPRAVLAAGVATGIAILVRSSMLVFVPLATLWLLRRRQFALAAGFVIVTVLTVAPWTARNYRAHGRLILGASDGGVTFWTGNHPLARGEGDLAANPTLKQAEIDFRAQYPGLNAQALEPHYYDDAFRHIRARPAWWVTLLIKKAFYTVIPIGPSYTLHSTRYLLSTVIPYAMLAPLALAGFVTIARDGQPPAFLYLLGFSVVLVCLIFFPQERFRIPVIDPLVIIGAAAAIAAATES